MCKIMYVMKKNFIISFYHMIDVDHCDNNMLELIFQGIVTVTVEHKCNGRGLKKAKRHYTLIVLYYATVTAWSCHFPLPRLLSNIQDLSEAVQSPHSILSKWAETIL